MARVLLSRTLWAAVEEAGVNPARSRHCHRGASPVSRRSCAAGPPSCAAGRPGGATIREPGDSGRPFLQRRSAVTPEEARRADMNHDGQALSQAENDGFHRVADGGEGITNGFLAGTLAAIQPPDAAAERAARERHQRLT